MTKFNHLNQSLWAYLQDELDSSSKEKLNLAIQKNPALQDAVSRVQTVHELLEILLPIMHESEGAFTDRIMEMWEEGEKLSKYEQERPVSNATVFRVDSPAPAKVFNRYPKVKWWAVAAVALVAFGIGFLPASSLHWKEAKVGVVTQRGVHDESMGLYKDVEGLAPWLQSEIQLSYDKEVRGLTRWNTWFRSRKQNVGIVVGEYAEGQLVVTVQTYRNNGETVQRRWVESFSSEEALYLNGKNFAARVGEELAETAWKRGPNEP